MKKIAIFASGSGTNTENIVKYFENHNDILVEIILTNRADAYVIDRAKKLNVDYQAFSRIDFYETENVLKILRERCIDFVVLAGFLWLIPDNLIREFPKKIINIHPALLPNYGGKGMYGMKVHESVIKNKENESGISIHYVNDKYDEGELIFQAKCNINAGDTPESLANKVHLLEYEYFPKVIEKAILGF